MIVNKELVVANRKKADIVSDLRRHKFRPFPKSAAAKASGETEPTVEDEDEEESDSNESQADFDYLLGMAIWSLTKEKVRFQPMASLTAFIHVSGTVDCASYGTSRREGVGVACAT
jgi:predicted NAD/FAD-binding protein